jgi:hypothetical protein
VSSVSYNAPEKTGAPAIPCGISTKRLKVIALPHFKHHQIPKQFAVVVFLLVMFGF